VINPIENYGLGRIIIPDYRDAHHLMSATLDMTESLDNLPVEKEYQLGPRLDQGNLPRCVAYAIEQFLASEPSFEKNPPTIDLIYSKAQAVDGIPGPHDGTTVRAGLKILSDMGNIESTYVWAYDINTLKRFLLTRGPVVFGVTWYDQMFRPDRSGLVRVGGTAVGGHSFLCCGYSQKTDLWHFCNSWGNSWGADGTFYMSSTDVSLLLKDYGEAGSAVDTHIVKATP